MGRHIANRRLVAGATVLAAGVGTVLGAGVASAAPVPSTLPQAPNVSTTDGETVTDSAGGQNLGSVNGSELAGLDATNGGLSGMGSGESQTGQASPATGALTPIDRFGDPVAVTDLADFGLDSFTANSLPGAP